MFSSPTKQTKPLSNRLEALLGDLSLSSSDGGSWVGVDEAAALLAVLELSTLSGADTNVGGVDLGAALVPNAWSVAVQKVIVRSLSKCQKGVLRASYSRVAVVVSDTSTGGELGVLAVTDILGTSVVGGQGEGGGDD